MSAPRLRNRRGPAMVQLEEAQALMLDALGLAAFGAPRSRIVTTAIKLYLDTVERERPEDWKKAMEFIEEFKRRNPEPARRHLRSVK